MIMLQFCLTDDNSNQSFLSDAYQSNNKVDSSSNSSPQHASGAVSPTHTPYFRTEDSQPPTLGQETMEGKACHTEKKNLILNETFKEINNSLYTQTNNYIFLY